MTIANETPAPELRWDGNRIELTLPVDHPHTHGGSAVDGIVMIVTPYIEDDNGATKTARIPAALMLCEGGSLDLRSATSPAALLDPRTSIRGARS